MNSAMKSWGRTVVLTDFDGTIATNDIGYNVISRYAGDGWHEINRAYCAGEIGSLEAYTRAAELFRVSREEILSYVLSHVTIDPYFIDFTVFCRDEGIDVKIVSDGLDFYIEAIMNRFGFRHLEYFANAVIFEADRRVSIRFPGFNKDCGKCGNCKSTILEAHRGFYEQILYIGDGYSDICPAMNADLVFAKGLLFEKLGERDKDCAHYDNFGDIIRYLKSSIQHPSRIRQLLD